ncbi:programmed cell death protein 4-like [Melia azedarach]|uniref:Programmed cell death protein 4-like n=1 Tax=Melia azedarach TaxID=155640 RepID=A0ACC1XB80_MELAZ|nr:programmed cell death protein 4-like [Melia azedarach]
MKKTGKSNGGARHNNGKSERSDKKSATGMNGSPKKGGHGGKYTWSGDGYSQAEIGFQDVVDVKDPNFEDPEDTVNA